MNLKLQTGTFPTMFRPSTRFSYEDPNDYDGKLIPDLSPEAKISDHDVSEIAFFARQIMNRSLDYLIINVYGSGANLPVRDCCIFNVVFLLSDTRFVGFFHFYEQNDLHRNGSGDVMLIIHLYFTDQFPIKCQERIDFLTASKR
jgi:hypothetical protein